MVSFIRYYDPLSSSLSMITQEGSTVQNYDVYNKEYIPDRRIRPTAILPECRISDPAEILAAGVVNQFLTDITWYQGEMKPENIILDTNKDFKIDRSSNTNNRGRITVYKNVPFGNPLILSFSATFVDMVGNNVRRKAIFQGFVYLTSSTFADAPLTFIPFCPRGDTFNPLSDMTYLPLCGDLKAGNELIPQAHWWYRKTASGLNLLGSEYEGYKSREIKIPTSEIGKDAHYVCRIKDCRHDLADLKETYLQEELDKIADYPRNLFAKQYFLDLNDEIKPGVVTEGEDADGKYICIPDPRILREYTGRDEKLDLFSGKISFKADTVYVIRIKGKYIFSEGVTNRGFLLTIVYTDGSSTIGYIVGGNNATNEIVLKTELGKTVSHLSSSYGIIIPTYIYDIQITEDYNYNLLEGDTEGVTVNASDSDNSNYIPVPIRPKKTLKKVTVSIDDIVNLKGDATEYSVAVYNYGTVSSTVSNYIILSKSIKTGILNLTDKYDASQPASLMLYAGRSGSTAGNSVKYKNVQLLEGEYAWNVLGEDIEEVTVEAGESPNQYTKIDIPNKLQIGGKYTLDVGDIINVEGAPDGYTVTIYQFEDMNVSVATEKGKLSQDKKTFTFTIKDNYNSDLPVYLLLYAGSYGNTIGNVIQFKNIRLLAGETVLPSMPSYTPHFIPSAPDIEVESERITLPEGYRPDGEPANYEEYDYTLTTAYPPEKWKICTPYGSSDDGLIDIPSDVQLFPAWAEIRTAEGVVETPEKYYSIDWGNGKRGINILLDASELSTDLLTLNPVLYRGLDKAKYAVRGCSLSSANMNKLEEFVEGSRIVVEIPPHAPKISGYLYVMKNGIGLMIAYMGNSGVTIFLYGDGIGKSTLLRGYQSAIQRYELRIGANLDEYQLILNGKLYTDTFNDSDGKEGSYVLVNENSLASLIEIYSPDNILLHKWNFEGNTDTERLSDKADTENKISINKVSEFELVPV